LGGETPAILKEEPVSGLMEENPEKGEEGEERNRLVKKGGTSRTVSHV